MYFGKGDAAGASAITTMIYASISSSLVPMVLQKIFVSRQPTIVTTKTTSWIDRLYDKYLPK